MSDEKSSSPEKTQVSRSFDTADGRSPKTRTDTDEIEGLADDAPPAHPDHKPHLSGTFGHYVVEELVGEGAMGRVYRARDSRLGRVVALKIPTRNTVASERDLKRFYREARAAANLHHPNICTVYDVGQHDGIHFIAMQYVPGKTLAEVIEDDSPLDPQWASSVVGKLASALAVAHEAGIVHRDLKPANIIIVDGSEPVVMDFGLAREFEDVDASRVTQEGMIVGSPVYMSPEQMAAMPLGPPTDIFSLGVVFYEMLTGRTPFSGSVISIATQVLNDTPPPIQDFRTDVPEQLDAICQTAMEKNPDDRFRSMRDFAAVLDAYIRSDTVDATLAGRLPFRLSDSTVSYSIGATKPKSITGPRVVVACGLLGLLVFGLAMAFLPNELPNSSNASETEMANVEADEVSRVTVDGRPATSPEDRDPIDDMLDSFGQGGPFSEGPDTQRKEMDRRLRAATGNERFDFWDVNHDGMIDSGELPPHVVTRSDQDGDHRLSQEEFNTAIRQLGRAIYAPPGQGGLPGQGPFRREQFGGGEFNQGPPNRGPLDRGPGRGFGPNPPPQDDSGPTGGPPGF